MLVLAAKALGPRRAMLRMLEATGCHQLLSVGSNLVDHADRSQYGRMKRKPQINTDEMIFVDSISKQSLLHSDNGNLECGKAAYSKAPDHNSICNSLALPKRVEHVECLNYRLCEYAGKASLFRYRKLFGWLFETLLNDIKVFSFYLISFFELARGRRVLFTS